MSLESYHKGYAAALAEGGTRAMNERTRLKIALKEILGELGHDKVQVDEAIQAACVCDFALLRTLFNLPPQKVKP